MCLFLANQLSQAVLIQLIQFSVSTEIVYTQWKSKQFYVKQVILL